MHDATANFSPRAKKAVALAAEEARRFNHAYLGVEHLLLGLARESDGVAARALANLGVDTPRLREAFAGIISLGDRPVTGEPLVTPRLLRVFELAAKEARASNTSVGTEHLLLALTLPAEQPAGAEDLELESLTGETAAGVASAAGLHLPPLAPGRIAQRLLEAAGIDLLQLRLEVFRMYTRMSGAGQARDHVVTCRVDDRTLGAIDALVEAGVYNTRSEAAARLILAGIEASQPLLAKVQTAVAEIRKVRQEAQAAAQEWTLPERRFDTPLPARRGVAIAPEEGKGAGTPSDVAAPATRE